MTKPVTRKLAVDCLLARFEMAMDVPLPCSVCGQPLLPGQNIHFDHIHADIFGGEHYHLNLRPIHYDPCHKSKTKRDAKDNAKVRHLSNPRQSKRPMSNKTWKKKMNGETVRRDR